MAFVLRMISRGRWLYEPSLYPWLSKDEPLADALNDLKTDNNTLSVYSVENSEPDLEKNAELKRIILALARMRYGPSNFDYTLIPIDNLKEAKIAFRSTPENGKTNDKYVDDRHIDLTNLTTTKLIALARLIQSNPQNIKRVKESVIKRYMNEK